MLGFRALSRAERRRLLRDAKKLKSSRLTVESLENRCVLAASNIAQNAVVTKVGLSTPPTQNYVEFASKVVAFSSQYSTTNYSASKALGAADVLTYGDSANSWSASSSNGTTESLTLGFGVPIFASTVAIRESFGGGFVTQVEVRNAATGAFTSVWAGTDTSPKGKLGVLEVNFSQTSFLVDAVRIKINTSATTGWEDVDCVELRGVQTANKAPTIAVGAASSTATVTGTTANLTVLGADDGGETSLKYNWAASTLPSGASQPTFSVNGTNAAKNSTVTFSKAGTYVLTATVVDAGGLQTTSSVTVVVNQTLTSVAVTPGTAALGLGATQQFTASAKDQFGQVLAAQPAFTWSATAGSISASGLYTAPNSAANATITAAAGGKSASASVTVQAVNFLGLQNATLANLVKSLNTDGSISRNDMLSIFTTVGGDGVVDTIEFADLKTIINNATTLQIANYVKVLATDVVFGNVANATYLGAALGNLAAGSSSTVLSNLVSKWFLGTDHPVTSYAYASVNGSLFVGGAAYTDSRQGYIGDCYFLAAVGTIAQVSPTAITNMIIDNGDNTYTVRFYAGGTADYVTVDKKLPVDSSGRLVYQSLGSAATNTGNELWLALLEKAYAQWNQTGKEGRDGTNTYAGIEGGWMSNVYAQVLGKSASNYFTLNSTAQAAAISAISSQYAITVGTISSPGNGLVGGHAYMVVGYNAANATFTLYNPWGSTQPGPLTWAQIAASCSGMSIANPSGSPGTTTVMAKVVSGNDGGGASDAAAGYFAAQTAATESNVGRSSVTVTTIGTTLVQAAATAVADSPVFVALSAAEETADDVRSIDSDTLELLSSTLRNRKVSVESSFDLLDAAYEALENG